MPRFFQKRIISFALVVAPLFTLIGIVQTLFVHREIYQPIVADQKALAVYISEQLAYTDKWNLDGYRNAIINSPGWFVITSNGFIIDSEEFIPGFFPQVKLLDNSEVGEQWHILKKNLNDGMVVVGTRTKGNENKVGQKLEENMSRFGSSLDQAIAEVKGGTRNIDNDIDFAIFDHSGVLVQAIGGIPMELDPTFLQRFSSSETEVKSGDRTYAIYAADVLNSKSQAIAKILIPTDVTIVKKAFLAQVWFNFWTAVFMWILVVLLSIPFLRGAIQRQHRLTELKGALQDGKLEESQTVEFKPAFQWDSRTSMRNKDLSFDFFLKPVTAFLNAEGGSLFIGIEKSGAICGINGDLKVFGNADKMQLEMMQLVSAKISPLHTQFVRVQFAQFSKHTGLEVCIVEVESARQPAFLKWNQEIHFFKRSGNKSEPLNPIDQHQYIQDKWS